MWVLPAPATRSGAVASYPIHIYAPLFAGRSHQVRIGRAGLFANLVAAFDEA